MIGVGREIPALAARARPGLGPWMQGGVAPLFVADFVRERYVRNGAFVPFAGAMSFARASAATCFDSAGRLIGVAADMPRFDHDPLSGERRGLLVETAATNLAAASADFTAGAWNRTRLAAFGAGSQADAAMAPDATLSADYLAQAGGQTMQGGAYQLRLPAVGVTRSLSVFARAGEKTFLTLAENSTGSAHYSHFDLTNGQLGTVAAQHEAGIVALRDGWVRVSIRWVPVAPAEFHIAYLADADGVASGLSTVLDSGGLWLWGAQIEEGGGPSSYVPIAGGQASRAADQPSLDLAAGSYDIRVVTAAGSTDLLSVVHAGGGYWPAGAIGHVAQVLAYPEGTL